jgi:tRNA pseudouridine38-40 synthase
MRIALGLSFDGSHYYGWQRQETVASVQAAVESAISFVADHPVEVICAGRTDRGVHALGQVAHFDTHAIRSDRAWMLGANSNLPADIRVRWVKPIDENFHARFSAIGRRYRYIIYNQAVNSALLHNKVTLHHRPLNESLMQEACSYFIGEYDFTSYRAVECQAKSPVRKIEFLTVKRSGDFIFIDIKANGFLHHMVRNITGVLMQIGEEKQKPIWAQEVLNARCRTKAGITASPCGLYFMEAYYPESFILPKHLGENIFI